MLKQKLIISSVALAATSFALAGGPGDFDAPAVDQQGVYLDANFGYGWNDLALTSKQKAVPSKVKCDDGFTANVNLGYQFSQNLAAEFGFFVIPDAKLDNGDKLESNFSYDLAVKGMLPFDDQFSAFAKLGVGFSTGKYNGSSWVDPTAGSKSAVTGFGALGLSWMPAQVPDLSVSVQGYAFLKSGTMPAHYGVLGGVGYLFPM